MITANNAKPKNRIQFSILNIFFILYQNINFQDILIIKKTIKQQIKNAIIAIILEVDVGSCKSFLLLENSVTTFIDFLSKKCLPIFRIKINMLNFYM